MDGKSVTTDGSLALDRKKVIVIEAEQHRQQKLRVAAYARVSTDSSDQANSFLAQMQRYHTLITGNENWDLVDVYADRGLSGVSAAKRPDFQRMLADCRQGRIDKILVKSISRFARNTKECLAFVRELKAIGVGVCFEEQNIDTAKVTGELLTSVFASIAQKESESISQNMRWSYQRRMENGTFLPGSTAYGYKIVEKKTVIDEAKAETVRRIFRDYLAGFGLREIARSLNEEGVPYIDDEPELHWSVRVVAYILSNEKYIGDSLWQKKYKTEGLPGKLLYNRGERKQYYAQGTHEAIIAKDVFEAAQELRKQRAGSYKGETPTGNDPLRGKVRCSVCGASFRKSDRSGKRYWVCRTHNADKDSCPVMPFPETELHEAFLRLYHKLRLHGDEVLAPLLADLQAVRKNKLLWHLDIVALNREISELAEQNQLLANMNQMGLVDPDLYIARSNEYTRRISEAKQKRSKLIQAGGGSDTIARTEELIDALEAMPGFLTEFDGGLFDELVECVFATADGKLVFHLTNGLELTEGTMRE